MSVRMNRSRWLTERRLLDAIRELASAIWS